MKKNSIYGYIFIVIGIILALIPDVIAPTCPKMETGMFMKCHWMGKAVLGSGILVILFGIIYTIAKKRTSRLVVSICNFCLSLYICAVPSFLIGGCMKPEMPCRAKTIPAVYFVTIVYLVVSVIAIFANRGKDDSANN